MLHWSDIHLPTCTIDISNYFNPMENLEYELPKYSNKQVISHQVLSPLPIYLIYVICKLQSPSEVTNLQFSSDIYTPEKTNKQQTSPENQCLEDEVSFLPWSFFGQEFLHFRGGGGSYHLMGLSLHNHIYAAMHTEITIDSKLFVSSKKQMFQPLL